ncbi:hypothetical protein PR048_003773 [Dryococelus australis]|uniref:Peptidase A2 domain-containing protein n=1 Tax=Dryococelus australis TaxID=614101 RepID=A0ABQ9INY6_9NEOP|nr:hypothetical protein PR048_003773 [Dryococelus australis]
MFNYILFLCTALDTMASKLTVEGKELDLQAALNHLASRLEGLKRENSDLKRQVASTPVNLNVDRSDLSVTVPMHVRNFTLLPTVPVFSSKPEANVRVYCIKIEQAADVYNWSESEQLAFVKLRLAGEGLDFVLADSACQEAENYEELKKHLLECFWQETHYSRLKILDNGSVEEFAHRIYKINANTYELVPTMSEMSILVKSKSFGKSVFAVEHNGDKLFFCHKAGHKIKDFRKGAKVYFGCGQLGHVVRVCREKGKQSKASDAHVDKNGKGRPLKLLIDTGAQVSLMWQHVGDLDLHCLQESKFVVSFLSGHKLKNLGGIFVNVLKQYRALVKVAKQSLQLGNKWYSLGECTSKGLLHGIVRPSLSIATEKILPGTGKIVCIMFSLPSVHVENHCTILVEPARKCDHCYVARNVTTVMPHEANLESPVNMSRAEVEIPWGTQIALLELLVKGDDFSCPCDVDECVVSENMNQSGSLRDMKLCGPVVTDDSELDLIGKLSNWSEEDKHLLESLLQEYEHIFRERQNFPVTPLVQHRVYPGDHS